MTILKFLGTVDIKKDDDYGRIHLRLAMDLLCAIRRHQPENVIRDKARNLVQVCCEPMFDDLTDAYDWSFEEFLYADEVIAQCIEVATHELLDIAQKRITHSRKHERRTKLRMEDMKLAAMMAYIMNVHNLVHDRLQDTFFEDHGAMYFST
jgi:hypothetical protein